ncbi:MAG: universal stress protein UspA [Rhizobiales bacterium 62-47]|nr:universal stress protein [Hyphomicrobiales bacterium]OJY09189.1 MAG: universal stress protein UspA [Rhizobiales bacterium 62-47]
MLKNLLVHIPSERPLRPVIDGAVSLAMIWTAQLDAISVGYETTSAGVTSIGNMELTTIIEDQRKKALERSDAALAVFDAEARNAGIAYNCRSISALPDEAADIVSGAARLYDLTIVLQPDSNDRTFDNSIPQEVLFQSGGPVLFIPHVHKGPVAPQHIGIAWDGSRLAARALRDALPFLKRAQTILVIAVNESRLAPSDLSCAAVVKRLEQRGLKASVLRLTADDAEVDQTILSAAADECLDLMIMGGYGHSRLQERFLGGVTRGMLQSMTLPTLMSH